MKPTEITECPESCNIGWSLMDAIDEALITNRSLTRRPFLTWISRRSVNRKLLYSTDLPPPSDAASRRRARVLEDTEFNQCTSHASMFVTS
jgi:hypothetical protein